MVCEVIYAPFDEGIRIFAAGLARALAKSHEVLLLSEKDSEVDGLKVQGVLTDRYFLSRRLAESIRSFSPECLIYVPWTSLTARTLLRVRALRSYAGSKASLGVVALQPRPAYLLTRALARAGRPDLVMAIGPAAQAQALKLGIPATRIAPGVDLDRFRPATAEQRALLKSRAGVDPMSYVVLHVGHMKRSRNIEVLEEVSRLDGVTCMLVTSSSTLAQQDLATRLWDSGVTVMTHHQDRIEFAYRMADAYLFPVTSELEAIETPLSVLEAAACDLEVVSTQFGGLPDLFPRGIHWADTPEEMVAALKRLAAAPRGDGPPVGTRRIVERLGWDAVAAQVMMSLEGQAG